MVRDPPGPFAVIHRTPLNSTTLAAWGMGTEVGGRWIPVAVDEPASLAGAVASCYSRLCLRARTAARLQLSVAPFARSPPSKARVGINQII